MDTSLGPLADDQFVGRTMKINFRQCGFCRNTTVEIYFCYAGRFTGECEEYVIEPTHNLTQGRSASLASNRSFHQLDVVFKCSGHLDASRMFCMIKITAVVILT